MEFMEGKYEWKGGGGGKKERRKRRKNRGMRDKRG